MSCGFINELGRFESDLQPEPDRKTESKISRTLKKFVNMDENKVRYVLKNQLTFLAEKFCFVICKNLQLCILSTSALNSRFLFSCSFCFLFLHRLKKIWPTKWLK